MLFCVGSLVRWAISSSYIELLFLLLVFRLMRLSKVLMFIIIVSLLIPTETWPVDAGSFLFFMYTTLLLLVSYELMSSNLRSLSLSFWAIYTFSYSLFKLWVLCLMLFAPLFKSRDFWHSSFIKSMLLSCLPLYGRITTPYWFRILPFFANFFLEI